MSIRLVGKKIEPSDRSHNHIQNIKKCLFYDNFLHLQQGGGKLDATTQPVVQEISAGKEGEKLDATTHWG